MPGYRSGRYDTLLSDSTVHLFGRELYELKIDHTRVTEIVEYEERLDAPPVNTRSHNKFLIEQLRNEDRGKDATLARVYSFSYRNELFDLYKPAIFLVHGIGSDPEHPYLSEERADRIQRQPPAADRTGLSSQVSRFPYGMRVWVYDIGDFTIRLDSESGTFDRVLLEFELGGQGSFDSTATAGGMTGPPRGPTRRYRRGRWRSKESEE